LFYAVILNAVKDPVFAFAVAIAVAVALAFLSVIPSGNLLLHFGVSAGFSPHNQRTPPPSGL
jgi:hypothetical protein